MEKKTVLTITITETGFTDTLEYNGASNSVEIIGVLDCIKHRLINEHHKHQPKKRKPTN